ncbi:MAG TPA: protein kinase, partial [Terriglobales bacterium]|nr:protein kinase [Terriglobales bacterium]
MSLFAGEKLGPYEIVGRLGAGGMGEVYRARDPRLQREVAIKILPAGMAQDAEALRRLEREARAIAALNHPNLLALYDIGALPNGSPFLVAELLEGATLRQRLAAGPLPQRKALDYAHQIARGLAAAHAKGIVHRDLKPDNLFCCDDGRVKILDFGLAKAVEAAGAEERTTAAPAGGAPVDTAAGVVLGTLGYMAPEQARGLAADARADIFSLGAVLYEMLAGQRAFRGETTADVISAILREEPPELTQSGRAVAPALERLVRHCLEKEPSQRFQSASDLAFDLQELSQASGSSLAAGSAPAPRRRRPLYAALGSAGLAAALALGWLAARATLAPPAPHLVRLTYQRGSIAGARFLPGGQDFIGAAAWNGSPVPTLFTGRLGSPGLQALAVPADAVAAVSPAGGVALLRDAHLDPAGGGGVVATLCSMPLGGGAPRPLLDEIEAADWPQGGDLAQSALLARFHPHRHQTTLEYPPGRVLYTTPDFISDPRLSRHGRRIAFLEHPIPGDDQGFVVVINRDGSGKRILTRDLPSTAGLAWSPRGDEVWFAANVGASARGLQAVNLAGKLRTLMEGLDELQLADVAADGRVLLIANDERFTTELVTPQQPTPRDVSILDLSDAPFLSADGRQLLL